MSEVSSRLTLISLVPRQVMLETATKASATSKEDNYNKKRKDKRVDVIGVEDEKKKGKKFYKNSDFCGDVSEEAEALMLGRSKGADNEMGREDLLRSIAAFLESSGFAKTLSVFLLEAQIEVNSGSSCINLENLFNKVIVPSHRDPIPTIEWPKGQGILIVDAADDSNAKAKNKKRKDKPTSDSIVNENVVKNYLDTSLGATESSLIVEKKKRRKVTISENKSEEGHLMFDKVEDKIEELKELTCNPSSEMGQVGKNRSEKKKKKKKADQSLEQSELRVNQEVFIEKTSDGCDYASTIHKKSVILSENNKGGEGCSNFEEVINEKINEFKHPTSNRGGDFTYSKHQESVNSENIVNDPLENVEGSKKNKMNVKTKKLEKLTSDSLPTINSDKLVENILDGLGKNDSDVLSKSGFRKESIVTPEEEYNDVEKSTNKKRKRSASNGTTILVENLIAASKSKLSNSDVSKKKKNPKVFTCTEVALLNGESKESSEALSSVVLNNQEENLISAQKHLNGYQLANGNVEKHQNEGSTRTESMKKEKHSREVKDLNAFQRIKVDDVQFADERLQDNSYWAMDDTGSGYGAKAQEVLGQVRGRDFRHEKTKKKRGTYRGGQIDLQAHSVKFNYSDDE